MFVDWAKTQHQPVAPTGGFSRLLIYCALSIVFPGKQQASFARLWLQRPSASPQRWMWLVHSVAENKIQSVSCWYWFRLSPSVCLIRQDRRWIERKDCKGELKIWNRKVEGGKRKRQCSHPAWANAQFLLTEPSSSLWSPSPLAQSHVCASCQLRGPTSFHYQMSAGPATSLQCLP